MGAFSSHLSTSGVRFRRKVDETIKFSLLIYPGAAIKLNMVEVMDQEIGIQMLNLAKKRIPNLLRRYRKARGLNQKQAARILGLRSGSMISRWEKGTGLPSSLNVFKLAILYRTMADPLFPNVTRLLRTDVLKREEEILRTGWGKNS